MSVLHEGAGEGVHRADTHEKARAPISTIQHLKQASRERDVIKRTGDFLDAHGHLGRQVVRFEWRAWKRILSTTHAKRWQGVKRKTHEVMSRIYREDERAAEDWSAIASKREDFPNPRTDTADDLEKVYEQYLGTVFERNRFYSVPQPSAEVEESGQLGPDTPVYFQVLDVVQGTSRPKLVPNIENNEEAYINKRLALNVQVYDPSEAPEAIGQVHPQVFPAGEQEWVGPTELAPVEKLHHEMVEWQYKPSTVVPDCTQLKNPTKTKSRLDLMDPSCPALVVYDALLARHWQPVQALCDHKDARVAEFDGRLSTRMRAYYQSLLAVEKTLPLTSHLPSQEPVRYYDLLLKGVAVEPGQAAKDLMVIWNGLRKRKGQPPEPIPLEDRAPPRDADKVILALPGLDPRAQSSGSGGSGPKRRRTTDAGGVGGAGGAHGPGGHAPHPPIVVEPPPIEDPSPPSVARAGR